MDLTALFQAEPWLATPIVLTSVVVSALASGRGWRRAAAALALALPGLAVPFFVPASMNVYRYFLTLSSMLPVIRVFDRARERQPVSVAHRVWAATAPFETREVTRAPARLDVARLAAVVGYGALATLGGWVTFVLARSHAGPLHYALRWIGGVVLVYATVDAVVGMINIGYRAFGLVLPPMHRTPAVSRSLQEFWGERWNLTMRDWFYRHCFMPFARRRRLVLGVAASFAASTLIHVWLVLVVSGWFLSAVMGSFFVAQGVLTLLERRLGVAGWRPAVGNAWTVLCLVISSPLFVEPVLRALEV